MVKDSYILKGQRKNLVNYLITKGIQDQRILNAFLDIPRHFFLEPAFAEWAYKDVPFKIEADQTISQPLTVAKMTTLLDVKEGDRILEIGTGSGFQACVLSYMGAKVYSIERQEKLHQQALHFLPSLGFENIRLLLGDGYEGAPLFAPYDKIIVTAGATEIPNKLLAQLKVDGLMVIPVGADDRTMFRIKKISPTSFEKEDHGVFKFVPFLPGVNSNQ
jgi:protein-L-isoaspartate(D-aspartate) O-methyltransferase